MGDAHEAHARSIAHGAVDVLAPRTLAAASAAAGHQVIAEVKLYGDVVLRFISNHGGFGGGGGGFMPGYHGVAVSPAGGAPLCYGLRRVDHAVGNVPNLLEAVDYITGFTGMHEFAEFTSADVGTVDSGLNSMVLANNNEMILMPVNEPTFGTKRKSQIQTYLEQNAGAGLQHLALKTGRA